MVQEVLKSDNSMRVLNLRLFPRLDRRNYSESIITIDRIDSVRQIFHLIISPLDLKTSPTTADTSLPIAQTHRISTWCRPMNNIDMQ